jgi:hypothetical protein
MIKRSALVAAAAAMLALLAVAGPASGMVRDDGYGTTAVGPAPAQATKGELIRAAALDRRYGNAWTRMSSGQFVALVKMFGNDVTTRYTPQQLRALVIRGETASASSDGFDWRDAGIGTLGAIGIVLGACAVIAVYVRSRRPHPALESAHGAV